MADEFRGVVKVVAAQTLGDEQRVFREAHEEMPLPPQVFLNPLLARPRMLPIDVLFLHARLTSTPIPTRARIASCEVKSAADRPVTSLTSHFTPTGRPETSTYQ